MPEKIAFRQPENPEKQSNPHTNYAKLARLILTQVSNPCGLILFKNLNKKENAMSATVETLENLERKVIVNLSWLAINEATDKEIKKAQKRVRVDGFRPGKAPLKMVAQMYGASIQGDAINKLAQSEFNKIVQEQNLRIAALTRVEPVENQEANSDNLQVAFVYETFPEIKVADLSTLNIEKVTAEVGDKEVNNVRAITA